MKKKYIVQSDKANLYEEFLNRDDALKCLKEHSCNCPYLEKVYYGDDYDDYLDDPEYKITILTIDGIDNKNTLEDIIPKKTTQNNYSFENELKNEYIECYKNYCNATYGDDYNLEEALNKGEYKTDGLGQVFKQMGCPPSKLKQYLNQYIKEKGEIK